MNLRTRLPGLLTVCIALACGGAVAATLDAEPLGTRPPTTAATATAAHAPGLRLTAVRLARLGTLAAPSDTGGSIDRSPGCAQDATGESTEAVRQRVEAELPAAFQRELAGARLGSARFTTAASGLEVGAFVNDLNAHVCHVGGDAWRGRFYVQVSWQVAQRRGGQTVYQASTAGFFDHTEASAATSAAAGLREAFAMSIRNLLADPRLAAVLQPAETDDETLASALPY